MHRAYSTCLIGITTVAALQAPASAVLVPAAGPGTGTAQVAHQLIVKGGAVAGAPVFQAPANYTPTATIGGAGGGMQSPGGGFRTFGALINQNQQALGLVANVPQTVTTAPGALGAGWNGATSTVVGVAGNGRAGIAATNTTVSNNGAATISANTTGASADYVNVGGALNGVKFGAFLSHTATVDGLGGFAAAAVRTQVLIDPFGGVGGAFGALGGVVTVAPNDLVMGFDGVGVGNADFFTGFDAGRGIFNTVGNSVTFAGIATTGAFNIPLGASVRLTGALTLIGDPASISSFDLPNTFDTSDFTLGFGDSSNAAQQLPEPSAIGLALAAMIFARRRRPRCD